MILDTCQKVEHYEIATYGGLYRLALTMGHSDVAEVLLQRMDEEKTADQLLTTIAEESVIMRQTKTNAF